MAEVELSGNPDIDGILCGFRWDTLNLTYSFPAAFATGVGEYTTYESITGFAPFDAGQQAAVNRIIGDVNRVCALNLTPGGVDSHIRFAEATTIDYSTAANQTAHVPGGANNSAEATTPFSTIDARTGDCWFNHTDYNGGAADFDVGVGDFAYAAGLMHELGHALGLEHGHQVQTITHNGHTHTKEMLPGDHDSQEYSIMTYRGYPGGPAVRSVDYPQTLMQNDIAALQYMYGAEFSTNDTATVYRWAPLSGTRADDGELFVNGASQGLATDNHILMTIWDGGGVDTYDFSNFSTDLDVSLVPGEWTSVGGQLANLAPPGATPRFARANIANALLYRDDPASLIENATGGAGDDTITGNQIGNHLIGNGGDDWLDGGSGADRMQGGNGGDTYVVDDPGDIVDDSVAPGIIIAGADTVRSFIDYVLPAQIEYLVLLGDAIVGEGNALGNTIFGDGRANTLRGLQGNDQLFGSIGDDHLTGGPGADTLVGGSEYDTASYTTYTNFIAVPLIVDLVDGGVGTGDAAGDTFNSVEALQGSGGNDTLRGDGESNVIHGLVGNDVLDGRGGFDFLHGSGGFDFLYGGDSIDQLFGGDDNDQLTGGPGADALDGGAGFDWARYDDLGDHPGELLFIDLVSGDTTGDTKIRIEGLIGSPGWDVIGGDGGSNDLWGLAGDDNLVGRGGIDFLHGGAGADMLNGGADFDWVMYDLAPSGVVARFDNPSLNTGDAAGDSYFQVEALSGSDFNDTLFGDAGDNQLYGQAGADRLDGGGGSDVMAGGPGGDTYFFTSTGDRVMENANEGTDTVYASVVWALGPNVEDLILLESGPSDLFGYGNELNNTMVGNSGGNRLLGEAGNDTLIGGLGADDLQGGSGDDWFYVDNASDQVSDSKGGGGADRVLSAVSYALASGQEIEKLTTFNNAGTNAINLTGNEFANAIYGNAGANSLDGQGGADSLNGFGGDDFYYVDSALDVVNEDAGGGTDRVFASATYALKAGSAVETLSTTSTGGTATIYLTGNELANTIYGNNGRNVLDGGGGADLFSGFGGDDWYFVDSAADVVDEFAGAGDDRVFASVSYALKADARVETLSTRSTAEQTAVNLTGNAFGNILIGNSGANTLDGKSGADSMTGFGGNDWYFVDNAGDSVADGAGGGTADRVFASVSYTLTAGAQIETVSTANHGGTSAIDLTGNERSGLIQGNAGANVLNGGLGNDTLVGLGGADVFFFNTALNAATNVDRLADFNVAADKIRLENAIFTALPLAGALPAGAFRIGAAAADADDRIIYNSATGALVYDSNGNATGGATQFATLAPGLAPTNADFVVV